MASSPSSGSPDPETVGFLLETVKGFLAAEDARASSVNARGGALVGFVGIILSLVGLLTSRPLAGDVPSGSSLVLAGVAVVLLLAAVCIVLFGVLLPKTGKTVAMEEIEKYPTYRYITQPLVMSQGRIMRGFIEMLSIERRRNARKALHFKIAASFVAAALFFVAAEAVVLGIQAR